MNIFIPLSFLLTCLLLPASVPNDSPGMMDESLNTDSFYIEKYKSIIRGEHVEMDTAVTEPEDPEELRVTEESEGEDPESESPEGQDEILATVTYAPDMSFKVFVFEQISCGAYCNSDWYAWIHFDLKTKEKIREINFTDIQSISKLAGGKYLIIESSWGRPASVFSISCIGARLISFAGAKVVEHPIRYRKENHFSFCQESDVNNDIQPYIRYDEKKKTLSYLYGNNYLYSQGLDVDTIRQGQFRYVNGQFLFEKEKVTVNDRTP